MPKTVTSITQIQQQIYSPTSGVNKFAESGLSLEPIGALNSPVNVGQYQPVLVFNSGASVAYVAFGAQTASAPTGPTNGIPILANEKVVVNSGINSYIVASAATVYGYAAQDQ